MSGSILALENSIVVIRGSTKTLDLTVKDSEGDAIDLTGSRILFTVKCRIEDRENVIQKDSDVGAAEIDIDDPKNGKAIVHILADDTAGLDLGKYVFDIWVVLASGAKHPVVGPSDFTILAGVTVIA